MNVPFWSYLPVFNQRRNEILAAVAKVFDSGRLILSDEVKSFERRFAAHVGANFGVGVNSGTDALFLALKAAGIGEGDEVITVPNTAIPTVSAITATGARTVLVDIDPATLLMDPALIEDKITQRTKCILPVHLYGQCADMKAIIKIADVHKLVVIEDCAQSHGAKQHGRHAGSIGRFGAFSFYPTKVLGAFGDGGLITTDDANDADKLRRIRMYGIRSNYVADEDGWNSRLDEVQAVILSVGLKYLDEDIATRQKFAAHYDQALQNLSVSLPQTGNGNTHVYYAYVLRHPSRESIILALDDLGVGVNVSYPTPIHLMPAYKKLGYVTGDFPVAEAACREVFSIPLHPGLTDKDVNYVCESVQRACAKR